MVSFGALRANVHLLHNGVKQGFTQDGNLFPSNYTGLSWLPQYHDLGLIYGCIAPFLGGWRMHYMSPITFLQQPLLWLQLCAQNKCHWTVAPDFAYGFAARRMREALAAGRAPPEMDLSCLHTMQNGAEPARPETRRDFETTFTPYGLRSSWFEAGYGLAEHVVGVSWLHDYIESRSHPGLAAVGAYSTFDKSLDVRIVDRDSCIEVTEDGATGELWVAGPSVAAGYYNQPELSEAAFEARIKGCLDNKVYLRTGDLAFFENGYLFICGRIKDLIISRGRNYYPQDLEFAAQQCDDAVRPGCVAAFSADETAHDGEVVLVFEIRTGREAQAEAIASAVRAAVTRDAGLAPTRITIIKERCIPKTTSGKIRRRATRQALADGTLKVVFDAVYDDRSAAAVALPDVDAVLASSTAAALRSSVADDEATCDYSEEVSTIRYLFV